MSKQKKYRIVKDPVVTLPPLHTAVANGNLFDVKALLSADHALLKSKDHKGRTALQYATELTKHTQARSDIKDCRVYLAYQEAEDKKDEDLYINAADQKSVTDDNTEAMMLSDTHNFQPGAGRLTQELKPFLHLGVEAQGNGEVKYTIRFTGMPRPNTEHGAKQEHHISAYSLMTESIVTLLDGQNIDQAGTLLLNHVIKYAPNGAKQFQTLLDSYNTQYGHLSQKAQRDLVSLTERRATQFLQKLQKELRGSHATLTPELKKQLEHVLILTEDKEQIAGPLEIKNQMKAGDNQKKFSGIVRLISNAIMLMNQEKGITFNDGTKPLGHGEAGAKTNLKKGEDPAINAAQLFDYPDAIFKNNKTGIQHYTASVVRHLNLIQDTYPHIQIDEAFIREFLDENNAADLFKGKGELSDLRKQVETFTEKVLAKHYQPTKHGKG